MFKQWPLASSRACYISSSASFAVSLDVIPFPGQQQHLGKSGGTVVCEELQPWLQHQQQSADANAEAAVQGRRVQDLSLSPSPVSHFMKLLLYNISSDCMVSVKVNYSAATAHKQQAGMLRSTAAILYVVTQSLLFSGYRNQSDGLISWS